MKKIWTWLEGKKTYIGVSIWVLNSIVRWKFPDALPTDIYESISITGQAIGGIGIFDKARRTEAGQKVQNSILNAIKKK